MADRRGFTLWFTGLSGAGKSTLARAVGDELRSRRHLVELLDGDEVRKHLSRGLGFSKDDRDTNIRRIGYFARVLSRNGVVDDRGGHFPLPRRARRDPAGTRSAVRRGLCRLSARRAEEARPEGALRRGVGRPPRRISAACRIRTSRRWLRRSPSTPIAKPWTSREPRSSAGWPAADCSTGSTRRDGMSAAISTRWYRIGLVAIALVYLHNTLPHLTMLPRVNVDEPWLMERAYQVMTNGRAEPADARVEDGVSAAGRLRVPAGAVDGGVWRRVFCRRGCSP